MRLQHQWWSGLVAAGLGGLVGVTAVAAAGAQFLPALVTREGAQRFLGGSPMDARNREAARGARALQNMGLRVIRRVRAKLTPNALCYEDTAQTRRGRWTGGDISSLESRGHSHLTSPVQLDLMFLGT